MKNRMRPTSFLFQAETLDELRRAALQESLDSDRRVTQSSIVRGLVEAYLRGRRDPLRASPGCDATPSIPCSDVA